MNKTEKLAYSVMYDKSNKERLGNVKNIHKELGDHFSFIDPKVIFIKSKQEVDEIVSKIYVNQKGPGFCSDMRLGAIGLLFGTLLTYEVALKNNVDILVMFEDDFVVAKNAGINIKKVLKRSADFDAICLDVNKNNFYKYDSKIHEMGDAFFSKIYNTWGTQLYAISSSGMKKILEYSKEKVLYPIDLALWDRSIIQTFMAYSVKPSFGNMFGYVDNIGADGHPEMRLSAISSTEYYNR